MIGDRCRRLPAWRPRRSSVPWRSGPWPAAASGRRPSRSPAVRRIVDDGGRGAGVPDRGRGRGARRPDLGRRRSCGRTGPPATRCFVFDPAAGTWTTGPTLPEAVHHAALVSTPSGLVLVGGYVGDELTDRPPRSDGSTTAPTAWTDDAPLPDSRAAGAAAFDGTGSSTPAASSRAASRARSSRSDRRRRVGDDRPACRRLASTSPRPRTVPGGRSCSAGASAASTATSRSSTSSRAHRCRRTLGDLPTQRGGVGGVLVAVARRVPRRRRVAGRHERAGRVHGRRRHARATPRPRRRAPRCRRGRRGRHGLRRARRSPARACSRATSPRRSASPDRAQQRYAATGYDFSQ